MESFEEVPAVQRQRVIETPSIERALELSCVAPEDVGLDANLLGASCDENISAERLPEKMQALSKRSPCLFDLGLGPEEGDKGVTTAKARRIRQREVRKKRETLGLDEHRPHLITTWSSEVERTEDVESHGCVGGTLLIARN